MVHTGVTIPTHLDIKAGSLEVSDKRQTATDGVWFALSQDLLGGLDQSVERLGVQVTRYPLS
jgi:hypothetical protein